MSLPLILAVALGGAAGSVGRHLVNHLLARGGGQVVPMATAIVNVVGCAAIGGLAGLIAAGRLEMSITMRAFVFVGILGGFTTFSSFALDTLTLAHGGRSAAAMWNVAGQVGVGLLSVFAAYAVAARAS